MKRHLILILAAISALPFPAIRAGASQPPVQTGAPGNSVEGSLTYNKETVRLKHAYAKLAEDDFEKGKFYITLLFTDRPVTEGVADRRLADKVKSGLLKAVSIRINSVTRRLHSYSVYADREHGELHSLPRTAERYRLELDDEQTRIRSKGPLREGRSATARKSIHLTSRFKADIKKNEWTGVFENFPPINIEPGRAEGKMSYDGKTRKLNHVYAQAETDMFDDQERKVKLVFTERPYSPGAPRKEHVPYLEFTLDR